MNRIFDFFTNKSNNRISRKIIKRLYEIPKDQWIPIYSKFNIWEFPEQFYDLIPMIDPYCWKGIGYKKKCNTALKIIAPVLAIITKEFGEKELLRYHNVNYGDMTYDEFEYWYEKVRPHINIVGKTSIQSSEYHNRKNKINKIKFWEDDIFEKLCKADVWEEFKK